MSIPEKLPAILPPPGQGFWILDAIHFPRPVTPYLSETRPKPFLDGCKHSLSRYGSHLERVEQRFSGGFAYLQIEPLASHSPELRRRIERCPAVLEEKLWRKDLKRWDEHEKPSIIAAQLALGRTELDALDAEGLISHLERCRQNYSQMVFLHHEYDLAAMLPVGDYLAQVGGMTGLPSEQLLQLLQGASPISVGASPELTALSDALRQDSESLDILVSDTPASEILTRLRQSQHAVGEAARRYLDIVGYRALSGCDIADPYALERPELLIRHVRQSLSPAKDDAQAIFNKTETIRDKVPQQRRAEFDELLAEARTVYGLRDERSLFCDVWAVGISRRAIRAAGARAAHAGRIGGADDILDAMPQEMIDILRGSEQAPPAELLRDRAERRLSLQISNAPQFFGDPPAPLALDSLPPSAQRIALAMDVMSAATMATPALAAPKKHVRGLGASAGVYEGIARHIRGPEDIDKVQKGDVLVSEFTSAALSILMPLVGAIITNKGGLLSHAAIVSREFGVPAVVGTTDASVRIPDGARVRVDGNCGEVTVL